MQHSRLAELCPRLLQLWRPGRAGVDVDAVVVLGDDAGERVADGREHERHGTGDLTQTNNN